MDDCYESFRYTKDFRERYKREHNRKELPFLFLLPLLLKNAIISDESIRFVKPMDEQLTEQHPHLNTIYRILAETMELLH